MRLYKFMCVLIICSCVFGLQVSASDWGVEEGKQLINEQNFLEAAQVLTLVYAHALETNNHTLEIESLYYIGEAYQKQGVINNNLSSLNTASDYYSKCIEKNYKYALPTILVSCFVGLIENDIFTRNYPRAEFYLNQSQKLFKDTPYINYLYELHGDLLFDKDNLSESLYFYEKIPLNEANDKIIRRINEIKAQTNEGSITIYDNSYIKDYNDEYYSIIIDLNIVNCYNVNFSIPLIQYSLYFYNPLDNFVDNENMIGAFGFTFNDRTLSSEEMEKLRTSQGRLLPEPQGGLLRKDYFIPHPISSEILAANSVYSLNISLLYKKDHYVNRIGSAILTNLNDVNIVYNKRILLSDKFLGTYNNLISDVPHRTQMGNTDYQFIWEKRLNSSSANFGNFFADSPIPYVSTDAEFGFVFGIIEPNSITKSFSEEIMLDPVLKQGLIKRSEVRKSNTANAKIAISTRLFYPSENINNIRFQLNEPQNSEEKIPEILRDNLMQKELNLRDRKLYLTTEEDNTRYLLFIINNTNEDIVFNYQYIIKLGEFLKSVNDYTWKLDYTKVYLPGEFADNWFNYAFKFDDPDIRIVAVTSTGKKSPLPSNTLNINFESNDFRTTEQISIIFEHLKLKRQYFNFNALCLNIVEIIIFIIILYLLYYFHFLTADNRVYNTIAILIALVSFGVSCFWNSYQENIHPYWVPVGLFMICALIIIIVIKRNHKHGDYPTHPIGRIHR